MGVFYTLFYGVVVLAPAVGGYLADLAGRVSITFDGGTAMLIASMILLLVFRRQTNPERVAGYTAPASRI
jgi:nitrate/nitrite transporter NarK